MTLHWIICFSQNVKKNEKIADIAWENKNRKRRNENENPIILALLVGQEAPYFFIIVSDKDA